MSLPVSGNLIVDAVVFFAALSGAVLVLSWVLPIVAMLFAAVAGLFGGRRKPAGSTKRRRGVPWRVVLGFWWAMIWRFTLVGIVLAIPLELAIGNKLSNDAATIVASLLAMLFAVRAALNRVAPVRIAPACRRCDRPTWIGADGTPALICDYCADAGWSVDDRRILLRPGESIVDADRVVRGAAIRDAAERLGEPPPAPSDG